MSAREILRVPLSDIEPDPLQPRKSFDEEALLRLARSLAESGQLHPLLAIRRNGRLVILDGERRWRAAGLAKCDAVDVIVLEDPMDSATALEAALVANLQREDLSPIEKARAIQGLMEQTGTSQAQVAARLGLSAASVSRTLALLSLPAEAQEKVASGELPASTAYAIARAQGADAETIAADAADQKLSREDVAARLGKGAKAGKHPVPTRVTAALGGGRTVTMTGVGLTSLDDLVQWLEELLAKAKKIRKGQPKGVELSTFAALLRDEARAAKPGTSEAGDERC